MDFLLPDLLVVLSTIRRKAESLETIPRLGQIYDYALEED